MRKTCERCGARIPPQRIANGKARGTAVRFCSAKCDAADRAARYYAKHKEKVLKKARAKSQADRSE